MSDQPADLDRPMDAAEFRTVREYLGLTGDWLAAHFDVSARTVRHWEAGKFPVPDGVSNEMQQLQARAGSSVAALVAELRDQVAPEVTVYRSDEQYHAAVPGAEYPARWHRHIAARAAGQIPTRLRIVYADTAQPDSTPNRDLLVRAAIILARDGASSFSSTQLRQATTPNAPVAAIARRVLAGYAHLRAGSLSAADLAVVEDAAEQARTVLGGQM